MAKKPTTPGERIRAARTKRHLSRNEVAYAYGCTASMICNWECGVRTPSGIKTWRKLATAIGCKIQDLVKL